MDISHVTHCSCNDVRVFVLADYELIVALSNFLKFARKSFHEIG